LRKALIKVNCEAEAADNAWGTFFPEEQSMSGLELTPEVQQWGMTALIWVGFGALAGLLAKAIMPGRDPGGPVATVVMGIAGCVFGTGAVMYFLPDLRIEPISIVGFLIAAAGAFLILALYRLLGGRFFYRTPGRVYGRLWWQGRRRRRVSVYPD